MIKRFLTACVGCALTLPAAAGNLPEIFVTEVLVSNGGIYTVTINQPPSPPGPIWSMVAVGMDNSQAAFTETFLTGWTTDVFSPEDWDSGLFFETFTPDLPIFLFESGVPGESTFDETFGMSSVQGVMYWNDSYLGNPLVATSSNFFWYTSDQGATKAAGEFNAFAVITAPGQDTFICGIGVELILPLECVPVTDQNSDSDGDFVPDQFDNCTLIENPSQIDEDGDGFGNACDPDLNNDGIVNFLDLSQFSQVFLSNNAVADFNSDGTVNFVDLIVLSDFFFQPPGPGLGF